MDGCQIIVEHPTIPDCFVIVGFLVNVVMPDTEIVSNMDLCVLSSIVAS